MSSRLVKLISSTVASTSEVQASPNITCSIEGSIVNTDTYAKLSQACVAESLSTQMSEKQAEVVCMDTNAMQDTKVIDECEIQTRYS